MEIHPNLNVMKNDYQIDKMKEDKEKAGEIFEKIFLDKMIKGMYKTTSFEDESSMEKDFYEEQMIDTLSNKIIESKLINLREKYLKDL